MTHHSFLKILASLLLSVGILLLVTSCAEDEPNKNPPTGVDYDETRLADYLAPVTYEGLIVRCQSPQETKSEAILRTLLAAATVKAYPEGSVEYYEGQLRAEYRYLAEREELTYEALLEIRGITEDDLHKEAKAMVKSDLVLLYIRKHADISLSEAEKTAFYDRYADRYVERFGYDRAYVDTHLREEIFDSMLFDKTMEYLLLHNEVTE
ncbi:MAG: hypothetical protein IKA76_06185 [Clostridia bacterium]|nr:hypothetical protein [Clostridia bacterium]